MLFANGTEEPGKEHLYAPRGTSCVLLAGASLKGKNGEMTKWHCSSPK